VSNEIDREAVVSVTELPNESVADWLEDFVRGECMFRSDEKPAMFSEIARRLRSTPDEGRCERDARIADLERRLKEAERDAGRYRWLRDIKCCNLRLTFNDHAVNYVTATDHIENHAAYWHADDDPAEVQRMKDTNTIWTLQIYPRTPIGFDCWNAATLDTAIDTAMGKEPG
jgi:hypothetical protein